MGHAPHVRGGAAPAGDVLNQHVALLATLAVEVPVVAALARLRRWPVPLGPLLLVAAGATLVTHPLLWGAMRALPGGVSWAVAVAALEAAVVLVEAGAYARLAGLGTRRGLVASLLANAASFGAGLALAA